MPAGLQRILVVDDETDLTHFLVMLLTRRTGLEVSSASDAAQALVELRRTPYHLVITDLNMPGMSGTSLLREIKSLDPDIEVILLTGHGSLQSAVESLQLAAFDYIAKPVDADRLVQTVRNALARQALAAELTATIAQVAQLNRDLKRRVREEIGVQAPRERLATAGALLDHVVSETAPSLDELARGLARCAADGGLPAPLAHAPQALTKVHDTLRELSDALARLQPARSRGDLVELVRAQAQELTSVFPWIELKLELPTGPVTAEFDPGSLAHALRLVLENAVQAVSERGELTVSARSSDGCFRVKIADGGPGFTAEALASLERPFGAPGTGMGLQIVRRIVAQLGGTLDAANGEEGGGVVTMAVPTSGGCA